MTAEHDRAVDQVEVRIDDGSVCTNPATTVMSGRVRAIRTAR